MAKQKTGEIIFVCTLLILSLLTHFLYFGYPNRLVFDEIYYVNFASHYTTGTFYFDVHPPLDKMLEAGVGYLTGTTPDTSMLSIGAPFSSNYYLWFRLLPTIAGTLFPIIIYLLARQLRLSPATSFFAGLCIIFENSLLLQSRLVLPDSLLLLFGFTGILLYLLGIKSTQTKSPLILKSLSALFLTAALSIKWTGLSFLGLVLLIEVWRYFSRRNTFSLKNILTTIGIFCVVPFIFYFIIFQIHFALLPYPGPGDAFMASTFHTKGAMTKFIELNTTMYTANATVGGHPYASQWYTWPLMLRPIYYWNGGPTWEAGSKIYLLGNPFIYWLSTLSVIGYLISFIWAFIRKKKIHKIGLLLFVGYLFNFLPFIGIHRSMFVYHYASALVFAILIMAYLLDRIRNNMIKYLILGGLSLFFIASFIYFSPLTYGLPIGIKAIESRFWIGSWK